ncbi:MAG: hypothetical protein ACKO9X_03730 [Dolichospermum sp.]
MLTAWQDWRDSVDIETLDASSYSLLPQLYQNLLAHGVDDTEMSRLKGIYRRNWYANQLKLKSLKAILSSLKDIGIEGYTNNVVNQDQTVSIAYNLLSD